MTLKYISDIDGNKTAERVEYISEIANRAESKDTGVDESNRTVSFYVLPEDIAASRGGAMSRTQDSVGLWVRADTYTNQEHSTTGHEWAHSIQNHHVDESLGWWIEGSADYIGGLLAVETRPEDEDEIEQGVFGYDWEKDSSRQSDDGELKEKYQSISLAQPDSWEARIDYNRGARVVYLIDMAIRDESDGDENILDLIRWMNEEETVSYVEFNEQVAEMTTTEFAWELDSYVKGTEIIDLDNEVDELFGNDSVQLPQDTFETNSTVDIEECNEDSESLPDNCL